MIRFTLLKNCKKHKTYSLSVYLKSTVQATLEIAYKIVFTYFVYHKNDEIKL